MRLERWAIFAWVLLLAVVCGRAVGWPHVHSVYPILANAARSWWAGADLYPQPSPSTGILDVYRYSPLVAACLAPLSMLPDPVGGVLWRLLNAIVLLTGLSSWCRSVLPAKASSKAWHPAIFLLVLSLAIGNFNNAQSNPLVLGLVLAGVASAADRRWSLASVFIAVACLFKLYPIAVGLLLVVVYPRQLAGRLATALAAGLLLPFLLQQPEYVLGQYAGWLESMLGDDRSVLALERCYRDLPMLGRIWHCPIGPDLYRIVQLVAGACMALICVVCQRRGCAQRRLLILLTGLGCCWMTVLGPATESCTYILLGPSLAWALIEAWTARGDVWRRGLTTAAYLLLLATFMSCWFPRRYHLQPTGTQPFAGLLFLAYLLADALSVCSRRDQTPAVQVAELSLAPSPP